MLRSDRTRSQFSPFARNSIAVIATVALAVTIVAAQDLPSTVTSAVTGTSAIRLPGFNGLSPLTGAVATKGTHDQVSNAIAAGFASGGDSAEGQSVRSGPPRRITLEQVKQQSASRVTSPLAYMSQLS